MNLKEIIISISLVFLIAVSIGCVCALEDDAIESADADASASEILVDGVGADDIANAIEKAEDGDTVSLGENRKYNIKNESIIITKKITLKGSNVTISSSSSKGGLALQANDISICGITFTNTVGKSLSGETSVAKSIYANGTCNLVVESCCFINYECGIDICDSKNVTIKNCLFNFTGPSTSEKESGKSTSEREATGVVKIEKRASDSSVIEVVVPGSSKSGMEAAGASTSLQALTCSKAIRMMDSTDISIIDNIFSSQIKDGLSIVSESERIYLENNTFINTTWNSSCLNQTYPLFEDVPSNLKLFMEKQSNLNTTGAISNEVRQLAKRIVGKTKGMEAVKKLAAWVSKNIAHETAPGFYQSPLVTLQRKKGNCCCHSELFLQMCASLGYTNKYDMYIVHVGTMKFGKRHFFTVIDNFCVDTSKKNPWGKGGFGRRSVYSITKYPYLPLLRAY